MIVRWRQRDGMTHVAEWQGYRLAVQFEPGVQRAPWRVYVNDVLVTHDREAQAAYWTARAAMEAVDAAVNRRVMELGRTAVAHQRALEVRHG